MHNITGKNITDSFYQALEYINANGQVFDTWKGKVLEIGPIILEIENPKERCLVIPHRYSNIIGTIAETLWVLGGRNDVKYLAQYLPRASDFSDDGATWRGAYGTRLKNWYGINQIDEVVKLLKKIPYTGRAVMSLFDPRIDYDTQSKDIPCNNWIQFLMRDGKLNMLVSVRANDLIWGFSGINMFEWTVLQELIAGWLGVEVGRYYHFVGSLNIFERHFERMDKMLNNRIEADIYDENDVSHTPVDISEASFEVLLQRFFALEEQFSCADDDGVNSLLKLISDLESRFLQQCAKLMFSYILFQREEYLLFMRVFITASKDDYRAAAFDFFNRKLSDDSKELLNWNKDV